MLLTPRSSRRTENREPWVPPDMGLIFFDERLPKLHRVYKCLYIITFIHTYILTYLHYLQKNDHDELSTIIIILGPFLFFSFFSPKDSYHLHFASYRWDKQYAESYRRIRPSLHADLVSALSSFQLLTTKRQSNLKRNLIHLSTMEINSPLYGVHSILLQPPRQNVLT